MSNQVWPTCFTNVSCCQTYGWFLPSRPQSQKMHISLRNWNRPPVRHQPVNLQARSHKYQQTSNHIPDRGESMIMKKRGKSFSPSLHNRYGLCFISRQTCMLLSGPLNPVTLTASFMCCHQLPEKKGEAGEAECPPENSGKAPDPPSSTTRSCEGAGLSVEQPFIKLSQEEYGEHHSSIMHCRSASYTQIKDHLRKWRGFTFEVM